MPNNNNIDEVEDLQNEDFDDFDDNDYAFIVGENGKLKSVVYPEELMDEPPKQIKQILKIFGIKNIEDLEEHTLH
jgi:Mg/Co/Ni transporter MgtE